MATKTFISPSDLTFGWAHCHRCLWLKYNEGVYPPVQMPLVGTLSALQEGHYRQMNTAAMNPVLPAGSVVGAGEWVVSAPIVVDGSTTDFKVRGKYDLLACLDSGTHAVIDCKVSGSDSNRADFYQPQLEAYAFALENPERGEPREVSLLGLLVWTPTSARGDAGSGYSFAVDAYWQPVRRDPARLAALLRDFIALITADTPPASGDDCRDCGYVAARKRLGV